MESKTTYFENPSRDNTEEVLRIARQRAEELGIKTVVVASTRGDTAVKAMDVLQGLRVIIVTHVTGFRTPDVQEFTEKSRQIVESKGGLIVTAAHAFGGLCRAMRQGDIPEANATYVVGDVVTATLRMFGQGMKVACEIAAMAADAGLVRSDEEVICIAGTGKAGRGSDTAVILQPAPAHRFFDMKVKEVLCKPRL